MGYGMDLGMSGYQLIGGIGSSHVAGVPSDLNVQAELAAPVILTRFVVPYHCEIVDFGVLITEDFVAQATDLVVRLSRSNTYGGSQTVIRDLTVGQSNTQILTRGDGDRNVLVPYPRDNQVQIAADTDLDNGDVVHANLDEVLESVGLHLWPGQTLIITHQVAATGAGGAYVPFVLVHISGPDFTQDNVWRELVDGEVVGD